MRTSILNKIIFVLVLIGILPIAVFTFLITDSYQGIIERHIPYIAEERPELVSETRLNLENIQNQTYLIFLFIVVFVFFFSIVLSRRLTYPIKKLIKATEKLEKGKLDTRIILKTGDEFQDLAESFNQMTKELQKALALLEDEKKVLEIRVAAKTRELRELVRTLDKKVKERTEELRIQRDRIASIIADLVDGLMVLDRNKNIILINTNAEFFLGVRAEQVRQKPIEDLIGQFYSLQKLFEIIGLKEIKGNINRKELFLENPQERILEVSTISLPTGEIVVILHDVTREKLVEKMKTDFVSIAAHQLRTPLSAIKWIIKMFLGGDLGRVHKKQVDFIEKAYASNEKMIMLVNDLLNITRIEEGRFLYNIQKKDISEIINNAKDSLKDKAKERKIDIKISLPKEKLPRVEVDHEKIGLAFQNLLNNAITYNKEKGRVIISVEHKKAEKEILVSIKDTGIGISKKDRQKLFSKFFRAVSAVRTDPDGSGLGLFIVKNVIEAHKGKIWFESEENQGTTFYFTLPVPQKGQNREKRTTAPLNNRDISLKAE